MGLLYLKLIKNVYINLNKLFTYFYLLRPLEYQIN